MGHTNKVSGMKVEQTVTNTPRICNDHLDRALSRPIRSLGGAATSITAGIFLRQREARDVPG
jgi:hypothetical protein